MTIYHDPLDTHPGRYGAVAFAIGGSIGGGVCAAVVQLGGRLMYGYLYDLPLFKAFLLGFCVCGGLAAWLMVADRLAEQDYRYELRQQPRPRQETTNGPMVRVSANTTRIANLKMTPDQWRWIADQQGRGPLQAKRLKRMIVGSGIPGQSDLYNDWPETVRRLRASKIIDADNRVTEQGYRAIMAEIRPGAARLVRNDEEE